MIILVIATLVLLFVAMVRYMQQATEIRELTAETRTIDKYAVNSSYDSYKRDRRTREELMQHQVQFGLLLDSLGMKFVPEKIEEVHQGMKHEAKVTPAKFVKGKTRN